MKGCTECNYKFTVYDRLKSLLNFKGYLKCKKCNSIYKPNPNIYRGVYTGLVVFIISFGFNYINLSNFKIKILLHFFTLFICLSLFNLVPHRWKKYTRIK